MRRLRETKKNYGWLVLLTLSSWVALAGVVLMVDPENVRDIPLEGSFLLMGVLVWMSLFTLLAIILGKVGRAVWWASGGVAYLYLRLWGLGSWWNGLLLLGLLVCGQVYGLMQGKSLSRQEVKEPL